MDTLDTLSAQVLKLAQRAGALMLEDRRLQVTSKGRHGDYVTQVDRAVQDLLMDELSKIMPGARFLAEEKENAALTDEPTFIIDPIDGTTNFFRRRGESVISIGLTEGKKPVRGWIWHPWRHTLYEAAKGRGAYQDGERLSVSDLPAEQALVYLGTASYYEELMELTGLSALKLLPNIADFRRTGTCALELCDIAAGRAEALFEWRLQPWDFCAGSLIVEEAGGRCGDILKGELGFSGPAPLLAANSRSFDRLCALLRDIWSAWSAGKSEL